MKLDTSKRYSEKSEVKFAGVKDEKNTLKSRSTLIVTNQMNDLILLDSVCAYLGTNIACRDNKNGSDHERMCPYHGRIMCIRRNRLIIILQHRSQSILLKS